MTDTDRSYELEDSKKEWLGKLRRWFNRGLTTYPKYKCQYRLIWARGGAEKVKYFYRFNYLSDRLHLIFGDADPLRKKLTKDMQNMLRDRSVVMNPPPPITHVRIERRQLGPWVEIEHSEVERLKELYDVEE